MAASREGTSWRAVAALGEASVRTHTSSLGAGVGLSASAGLLAGRDQEEAITEADIRQTLRDHGVKV